MISTHFGYSYGVLPIKRIQCRLGYGPEQQTGDPCMYSPVPVQVARKQETPRTDAALAGNGIMCSLGIAEQACHSTSASIQQLLVPVIKGGTGVKAPIHSMKLT